MYPDHGCRGEVALGSLPSDVERRLLDVPGEWLEFEAETGRIVVRHAQPSSGPDLPKIAGELVQMLSLIPVELHPAIGGGDFYVHTYDTGQFVRVHVGVGGRISLQWAHPDFASASKRPYEGRKETRIDRHYHRLDGLVTFKSDDSAAAAAAIQEVVDTFEGLYPEGDCLSRFDAATGRVEVEMQALNLDGHLLIERLLDLARPGSLDGRFTIGSFGAEAQPEEILRVVFEEGKVYVQRPVLWPEASSAQA